MTRHSPLRPLRILPALLIAAVATAWTFSACNTSGCTENRSAIPLAGFYSEETEQPILLNAVDIGGVGAPHDSLLISAGESVKSLYLPFRSEGSSTAFFIHYAQEPIDDPAFNDTLWFDYDSEPRFVSQECGAMYFYRITGLRYTTHVLRRVEILDSLITNVNVERIRLYYSTPDEAEEEPDESEESEESDEPEEPGGESLSARREVRR